VADLIIPGRRIFAAVSSALGLRGSKSLTKVDLEAAIAVFSTQPAVEASSTLRTFIKSKTDIAGGATTEVTHDFRAPNSWDEIYTRRDVGTATEGVPDDEEIWVIGAGVLATSSANFTRAMMYLEHPTIVTGDATESLYYADTASTAHVIGQAGALGTPFMTPLPWWLPLPGLSAGVIKSTIVTSGVVTTNILFRVLSAPPGVFKRLY